MACVVMMIATLQAENARLRDALAEARRELTHWRGLGHDTAVNATVAKIDAAL